DEFLKIAAQHWRYKIGGRGDWDLDVAAMAFIRQFRNGFYGRFTLDEVIESEKSESQPSESNQPLMSDSVHASEPCQTSASVAKSKSPTSVGAVQSPILQQRHPGRRRHTSI